MGSTVYFLTNQAGLVLFGVIFLEQIGLPIPAAPWLLAAGAISATGKLNALLALVVAVVACLLADVIWFYFGRFKGDQALRILCRVSLEPDSCVRRTQRIFTRYGVVGIVAAKFLPGLGTLFPPLAGMSRLCFCRFLLYDAFGALLYSGCFIFLGSVFSSELEQVGSVLASFTKATLWIIAGLAGLYVVFKYVQRRSLAHREVALEVGLPTRR